MGRGAGAAEKHGLKYHIHGAHIPKHQKNKHENNNKYDTNQIRNNDPLNFNVIDMYIYVCILYKMYI